MVDNHELEKRAMDCFRNGDAETGHRLQKEFLDEMKGSGEDLCSCKKNCRYHGKCLDCVMLHRGHGEHLPECFRGILNRRIEALSALTEHSFKDDK